MRFINTRIVTCNGIFNLVKITPELSEICGIHAGDGHLKKNQKEFEISGGFEEKKYYENHVIPLFQSVFNIKIKGIYFPSKSTYGFRLCSKNIVKVIENLGFPYGNKSTTARIPIQILNSRNSEIRRAFLRGIFDTDGSICFMRRKNTT